MGSKNKQYRIEKGLLLFTQPRSPYFYGKIRLNRKYVTKSFAPIKDLEEAKVMLYEWEKELLSKRAIPSTTISTNENFKSRSEYVDHVALKNDFQFLDVARYDPSKRNIEERLSAKYKNRFKIILVPNITNISYGRGVGYKIEEIILPDHIQKISATKIRKELRDKRKLK